MVGRTLSHYTILEKIGSAGMEEVYKAKDSRLDRAVAIKVLPEPLSRDPARRERFEREARIVSSLNHSHICTLHDVGHDDGVDFLVMDGERIVFRSTFPQITDDIRTRSGPSRLKYYLKSRG